MGIGRGDVLSLPIEVPGADQGERALGRVEAAARRVVSATDTAGRSTGGLSSAMRSLDDAVDSVEKPMRALNGALDIASVALGVGLAGPLGVVIGQFVDFGGAAIAAAESAGLFARSSAAIAADIRAVGDAAVSSQESVTRFFAALGASPTGAGASVGQRAAVERAGVQIGALEAEAAQLRRDVQAAIATQTEARRIIESTTGELTRQVGPVRSRSEGDALRQQREVARAELERAALIERSFLVQLEDRESRIAAIQQRTTAALAASVAAQGAASAATASTTTATESATRASVARASAVEQETASIKGLEAALRSIDPLVTRASEDVRAARLSREVEAGTRGVSDGLFPSTRSTADVLAQGADAFGGDDEPQVARAATATEAALASTLTAATDLSTIGVQALQTFSQAAGSALASVIIDGDAAGQSFAKIVGQTAAGLSATLFAYSIFLGVMAGVALATGPILGFGAGPIGSAALAAAAGGASLALIARAAGVSTRGGTTGGSRGASGGGGGRDRVASLSQGAGGGSMPVNVTVILGVDQVSRVLVDGSRREARAGSMSGSRLAVA